MTISWILVMLRVVSSLIAPVPSSIPRKIFDSFADGASNPCGARSKLHSATGLACAGDRAT
jgi:hypothetical protein